VRGGELPSPENPLRMPTLVIVSTCCSVGVRALLASCLTDAVRRHFLWSCLTDAIRRHFLWSCLTDAVRRRVASLARPIARFAASLARPIARFAASLAGRIGAEVGGLPGLGAFWLLCGSAFGATVHDAAHDAFMTLPP